jgi:Tfp pilus assembly protein PilZ
MPDMLDSDQQTDRYGVTLRLFNLISVLPRDQQLILLKQLVGDKVTAHLFKLIVEMSEDQQLILLEQMGYHIESEPPERTVRLEGTEPSMRENPRKSCLINANYQIRGNDFRSYILDISIGGVFIETKERVAIGENITLNFSLPSLAQPFSMTGMIAWSGPSGFGVKFKTPPAVQGQAIRSFVEKTE